MTENRRIILNIAATYARSILNVACGLFSVRWLLQALGQDDYGLYGVVGGLTVFISFVNSQFSGAVSRFFGVAIGERRVTEDKVKALENCREWFSTAITIHTIVPILFMLVGYPIGEYVLRIGWVSIPPERLETCVWVWRIACIGCMTSMMITPFWAMYIARQNIAEMTAYGVIQTIVRTAFFYYMTIVPKDWLLGYAWGMLVINNIPFVFYLVGCFVRFEECRIRVSGLIDIRRIREISLFVSWETIHAIGGMVKSQGLSVAVNNVLGARVNSAMAIGNQLAAESASLTGALLNAFAPAIVTAYGAKDFMRMRSLAVSACKYGALLVLAFAIPLVFEIDGVLELWLKVPPIHTAELCYFMIFVFVLQKLSQGQYIVIGAAGDIAHHRLLRAGGYMVALVIAVIGLKCGWGVHAVGLSLVVSALLSLCFDVVCARDKMQWRIVDWLREVLVPVLFVAICTSFAGWLSITLFGRSFFRIVLTVSFCLVAFVIVTYYFALTHDERVLLKRIIVKRLAGRKQ